MFSEKQRLKIILACYANVSSEFAMFSNPKYRGENFSWEWFIEHCYALGDLWCMLSCEVNERNRAAAKAFAKDCSKEIAETLVSKLCSTNGVKGSV